MRQSNDQNRLSVRPAMMADGGEQSCNHDHRLWKNISQPRCEGPMQAPWQRTNIWQQCLDIFFIFLFRSAPSSAQDTCSQVGILPKGAQGHPRAQDHHTAQHLASIGMKSALVDLLGVACQAIVSNGKSHKAGSISNHRGPTDTPHTHTHPDHYPST
jgi:hypothetical protein